MFSLFYDFIQFLAVLALLPKLIVNLVFKKDKSLFPYLGFCLPKAKPSQELCFILYAVSVGEVKAAASLFIQMKKVYPKAAFFVSSRTKTGLEEAKRSLLGADSYFLFPFDFSWIGKKMLNQIRPHAIFIIEGDLWYNCLKMARKRGALVCLVSGKISSESYKRFSFFPYFSKKLFSLFTLICAQNTTFAERFISLGAAPDSVLVTGNIKLGAENPKKSQSSLVFLKKRLGIKEGDFVVVLGSTHYPEEEKMMRIFTSFWSLFPQLKCLIVPRHPERFLEVKQTLSLLKTPFISFSDLENKTGEEKVVLVDKMGLLSDLYQLADLAIVGGSFDSSLKGHNILEPIQRGTPVLFGPYMKDQIELVDLVLFYRAGERVDIASLYSKIEFFIQDPGLLSDLKKNGEWLLQEMKGAVLPVCSLIQEHIESTR